MDDCIGRPCQNGGKCTDLINGYMCTCLDDYFGLHCQYGMCYASNYTGMIDTEYVGFFSFHNAHMPQCSFRKLFYSTI